MSDNSLPISSVSISVPNENAKRRTANYIPSIWGDHFLKHACDSDTMNQDDIEQQIQKLKGEVKMMLAADVFLRFKDTSMGSFNESIVTDTRGLLSLYEASQLRVRGEGVLEEAQVLALNHLKRCIEEYNGPTVLAARVSRALSQCLRKGLPRVEARHYIPVYESDGSHDKVLLALAKLDFNFLQKHHQKELADISRWWKDLDFERKLPFIRDRVVESYFWTLGVYFEPHYSLARIIFTKVFKLTSVMDDIYDAYGFPEELRSLTCAIERWDRRETCKLPDYLQVFYNALLDVFDEIEEKLADMEGKSYRLFYAREAMKIQARAYFDEVKWLSRPEVPTFEEYMSVALVSSGYSNLMAISFVGMGEVTNEHAFEWSLSNHTKIITDSAVIGRLVNDIFSHKFEQERGHVPKAVECYMKQHGVSEQQAKEYLLKEIDCAWMDINEGLLSPPVRCPGDLSHSCPQPRTMYRRTL